MVIVQFLLEGKAAFPLAAIDIENRRRRYAMLTLAVPPECTSVRFHAAFRKFCVGLLLAVDDFHCLGNTRCYFQVFIIHHLLHVIDDEKLLDVEFSMPYIVAVQADQIGASNVDSTLLQHPLLISNIGRIFLQLCLLAVELRKLVLFTS